METPYQPTTEIEALEVEIHTKETLLSRRLGDFYDLRDQIDERRLELAILQRKLIHLLKAQASQTEEASG